MRIPIKVEIKIEYYPPYLKVGEVRGDEKAEFEIVAKDEEELAELVKEIAKNFYDLRKENKK